MSKKHMLLMIAGCLIAFGVAATVFFFEVPTNNLFIVLLILICPLSHFLMMGHNSHEHQPKTDHSSITSSKE
ncbi:MAG: hypothetical protein CVU39_07405 [Chloroflexi bacterium HGW-Chloroflexi-10]|nr:MAG: hypothetical protein CVU39_07405 [Chloroflexi bacterium HGW-Chloroflexi-10]